MNIIEQAKQAKLRKALLEAEEIVRQEEKWKLQEDSNKSMRRIVVDIFQEISNKTDLVFSDIDYSSHQLKSRNGTILITVDLCYNFLSDGKRYFRTSYGNIGNSLSVNTVEIPYLENLSLENNREFFIEEFSRILANYI